MLDSEFLKLFALFGVCAIFYLGLTVCINRRLKSRHLALWESLGSPTHFWPSPVGSSRFILFLGKFDFLRTQDPFLIGLCFISVCVFAIAVILFVKVWTLASSEIRGGP